MPEEPTPDNIEKKDKSSANTIQLNPLITSQGTRISLDDFIKIITEAGVEGSENVRNILNKFKNSEVKDALQGGAYVVMLGERIPLSMDEIHLLFKWNPQDPYLAWAKSNPESIWEIVKFKNKSDILAIKSKTMIATRAVKILEEINPNSPAIPLLSSKEIGFKLIGYVEPNEILKREKLGNRILSSLAHRLDNQLINTLNFYFTDKTGDSMAGMLIRSMLSELMKEG